MSRSHPSRPDSAATRPRVALGLGLAALLVLVAVASPLPARQSAQLDRVRGQALFEEKRYADAVEAFVRVVAAADASAADWFNLALARYEANDDPAALAALDEAGARDPELISVPYLRGLIAKRTDRPEEARDAFARATGGDPADPALLYNLAWALEATGRTAEAEPIYDRIVGMGFDIGLQHYVSSLYRRGFLQVRAGEREAGQENLVLYRDAQQRLSQAQRAPSALEAGRHKRILPAPLRVAPPAGAAAARVVFESVSLAPSGEVIAEVLLERSALVLLAEEGGVVWADGERRPAPLPVGPAALGDGDRDGAPDLAVVTAGGLELARNRLGEEGAPFESWPVEGLPAVSTASSIHWIDIDHDGDLDLVLTQRAVPGLRLIDNLGGGVFRETTTEAGLAGAPAAEGLTWADFDGDNDTDLYTWGGPGGALYTNLRSGRFEEIGAAVGAAPAGLAPTAAIAEDLDNDGDFDLGLLAAEGIHLLANDGDGTFTGAGTYQAPGAADLAAADLDNDGWLDWVLGGAAGVGWAPARGELTWDPLLPSADGRLEAVLDWDLDGGLDLLLRSGDDLVLARQSGPPGRWLTVALAGIKNNLAGRGAKVEVKSGDGYRLATVREGRAHFGLGDADSAAVVRITWPNGIIQNELDVPADGLLGPVTEVERLEGSCPLLYTWDGEGWRFINEVLGVAPLGMPLAVGVIHPADHDEYVPVPGDALKVRDGRLEMRFTEELREAGYLDAMRLLAVDRPAHVRLLPDEKFVAPPHPEFRLLAVTEPRPVRALDQDGVDWTASLAAVDRDWTRPFERDRYEGLATPHWLELELPEARAGESVRLYLTGWVYWATGSINVVVDEDPRTTFEPVSLWVQEGDRWRLAIPDIGLPNAKNSTLAVELSELVAAGHTRFRIATTMRLYWDAAFYTSGDIHPDGIRPQGNWSGEWGVPNAGPLALAGRPGDPLPRVTVLAPAAASIRYRGFSRLEQGPDGYETFDYATLDATAPWDQHRGTYTRYGEVTELLAAADDRYVIVGTGDEVAVSFAADLPPLPAGWERDWLVYLNGWVKDGDPNTLGGDRVEPLPFHGMSLYPYGAGEAFPDGEAHRAWAESYNTRPARRTHAPLAPGASTEPPPPGRR